MDGDDGNEPETIMEDGNGKYKEISATRILLLDCIHSVSLFHDFQWD